MTVYRTYGRVEKRPYAYGDRLDIDVPLPEYAEQFWPPKLSSKWFLQVEDNDRDSQTGYVMERILARRYRDPYCHSVDHWKTKTFKYSKHVPIPDATGEPVASIKPGPGTANPYHSAPNSKPGVATLYMPEGNFQLGGLTLSEAKCRIAFDEENSPIFLSSKAEMRGKLQSTGIFPHGLPDKKVELYQLKPATSINKPPTWKYVSSVTTDAKGNFQFNVSQPIFLLKDRIYGVANEGVNGQTLCSTMPLTIKKKPAPDLWKWEKIKVDDYRYPIPTVPLNLPGLDEVNTSKLQ